MIGIKQYQGYSESLTVSETHTVPETNEYQESDGIELFFDDLFDTTSETVAQPEGSYTSNIITVPDNQVRRVVSYDLDTVNCDVDVQVSVDGGDFVSRSSGSTIPDGTEIQYRYEVTTIDRFGAQPTVSGEIQFLYQDDVDIQGEGTADFKPTVTVNFEGDSEYFEFFTKSLGGYMKFEHDYKDGDTLIIDMSNFTVRYNNSNGLKQLVTGDFFSIPPQETEVEFNADNNVRVAIDYNYRWL